MNRNMRCWLARRSCTPSASSHERGGRGCRRCWIGSTGAADTTQTKNVGAGLLANAQCQSTTQSTDPPLSRASPLPHGLCSVT
ncbi:hypothetical protein FW764_16385 [Pseudomonas sp. 1152_12]